MTTLGLSIAKEQDYDIVTPSAEFHERLLATREDRIFDALLAETPTQDPTATQARNDLGQLVIAMAGVNLNALDVESIPALQESRHFRGFQKLIRARARNIERREGDGLYERDVKDTAEEIIEAWQGTRRDVSGDVGDAFFGETSTVSSEAARHVLMGAVDVFAAGGVAVGILLSAARARGKRATGPYGYLTEVLAKENRAIRMTFPLGLER